MSGPASAGGLWRSPLSKRHRTGRLAGAGSCRPALLRETVDLGGGC